MKAFRPALIITALLLAGCASSGSTTSSDSSWWNPFSKISWSSLSPLNWFHSSLKVSEQGVGGLTSATPMNRDAIDKGLNGDYTLRQGMRSEKGAVVSFWQAVDDGEVKLAIYGKSSIERIEVTDSDIASVDGTKLGDTFSQHYQKAFGNCQQAEGVGENGVECKAPNSQHISYVYHGKWAGPEGLMPPDDTLKSWTVTKIIWRR
ncbi:outer membrane lipoprotein [Paramixta manurensis]|uniref:Outer membrane lipoprotein n=1 Tax=Paramixta manurensis TaxID=2740817 RepID=A0A6M8UGY9_9GAMM|nr:outer membrane lipoprotein [Erwiniaceae bacterium PD-1]